jgi:hypothetical protein
LLQGKGRKQNDFSWKGELGTKARKIAAIMLAESSPRSRMGVRLELGRIIFGEMVFGIALHVNYA